MSYKKCSIFYILSLYRIWNRTLQVLVRKGPFQAQYMIIKFRTNKYGSILPLQNVKFSRNLKSQITQTIRFRRSYLSFTDKRMENFISVNPTKICCWSYLLLVCWLDYLLNEHPLVKKLNLIWLGISNMFQVLFTRKPRKSQ